MGDEEILYKVIFLPYRNQWTRQTFYRTEFDLVYPAVEYDFVPNRLEIPVNSYVHIQ